jgi:hypothetical protein
MPFTDRVPEAVGVAIGQLRAVVENERLPYGARVEVAAAVRRLIVPRRKPGPKGSRDDAAYADYRSGLRGLALFRKFIPGHDKMGRWRRRIEERRFMNTLQKRASRDRRRRKMRLEKNFHNGGADLD